VPRRSGPSRKRDVLEQAQDFRPENFPIGSPESRAAARARLLQQRKRVRLILYALDGPLKLESSTCERLIWPDGSLCEVVFLDGRYTDLTSAELEAFIGQHPITGKE
jgi:hypothetical protein